MAYVISCMDWVVEIIAIYIRVVAKLGMIDVSPAIGGGERALPASYVTSLLRYCFNRLFRFHKSHQPTTTGFGIFIL